MNRARNIPPRPSRPGRDVIAMVDLAPMLRQTEPTWREHLSELQTKMQFVLGEQMRLFEREFAGHLEAKYCVGTGSGTAALEICLRSAGIHSRTQEVLTAALTSPFTAQAVLAAGGQPGFCDVEEDTLLMAPEQAADRCTRRTAALLPVHLYGQPCDLRRFAALARKLRVPLVQDACQAHGAKFQGRPFTAFSRWVAYSFYPTKNLGCLGDGGAVVTNSSLVDNRLRLLRDGGRRGDQLSRIPALNSRLDELQCCFLRAFLPQLQAWNSERARLAALYDEALRDCPGVRVLRRSPGSVNHLYVVRVKRREQLRRHLLELGIQTAVHYPIPLHLHPAFRQPRISRGAFPVAEKACREIVSLPLRPFLSQSNTLRTAEAIRQFYL